MVEQHVNVNCEGIKNYNYEDHSTLGEMHTIQSCMEGSLLHICSMITIIYIKNSTYIRSQYGKEHENGTDDTVR